MIIMTFENEEKVANELYLSEQIESNKKVLMHPTAKIEAIF